MPLTCSFSCCRLWGKLKLLGQGVFQTATNKSWLLVLPKLITPFPMPSSFSQPKSKRTRLGKYIFFLFWQRGSWVWDIDIWTVLWVPAIRVCIPHPMRISIYLCARSTFVSFIAFAAGRQLTEHLFLPFRMTYERAICTRRWTRPKWHYQELLAPPWVALLVLLPLSTDPSGRARCPFDIVCYEKPTTTYPMWSISTDKKHLSHEGLIYVK